MTSEPTISRDIPQETEELWLVLAEIRWPVRAHRLTVSGPPWDEYEWFVHMAPRVAKWKVSERSGFAIPGVSCASRKEAIAEAEEVMRKEGGRTPRSVIRGYLEGARQRAAKVPKRGTEDASDTA